MPLQPHETALTQAPAPPRPVPVIADAAAALALADTLASDFAEAAVERDLERRLPFAEIERFTETGLWAITVPQEYGGPGLDSATVAQVIARISAADGSLGQIPQNHYYALEVLRVGGSSEQQKLFFGRALAGERFGNALAEIGTKDFRRRTRLIRDADGWFVDGRKSIAPARSTPIGSRRWSSRKMTRRFSPSCPGRRRASP